MIPDKKKITLFAVYFTFFVDTLSWAVVFPIFAPYFLDPANPLLPTDLSAETRSMILGFFLMAFSLGQFLGAPVIGEYADKYGRKKALIGGVFFTLIGLSLTAWSMQIHSLFFLFAGRLITGIFASTTSICLSCVSDLSEDEQVKTKNFGYFSMAAGLAFVGGAFLGGKLSDPSISLLFTAYFPLWLAVFLTFVNLIFVIFGFKETYEIQAKAPFSFFASFQNIQLVLKTKKLKQVYLVFFLFFFAWTILFQFISVLTVEKFYFTNSNIGDLALFMGLCWAIGSGYVNKWLAQRFRAAHILEWCLLGFTLFCGLMIFPEHIYEVLAILGLCVILGGIAWPLCTSLISNMAPQQMQGKIMGISQSIQSFAMTLGPIVGGVAFNVSLGFPFMIAAATSLLSVVIYYLILKDR